MTKKRKTLMDQIKPKPAPKKRKPRKPKPPKRDTLATPRTPLKAIRAKCLDCSCHSHNEIKDCNIKHCPLYPFRHGTDPYSRKPKAPTNQEEDSVK